ncbi:hypothetical protein [Enterobacter sp. Bisph1]|uniref:hypothetical protein n=1 Tax=Enterobacter sp. Bisph1 TaxID=1274399 RepID=UPI00057C0376|nr:hypothetical protein [Enterobacter sp. Bisph1]
MCYKKFCILLLSLIFCGAAVADGNMDKPTAKASELAKRYVLANETDKPSVLQEFDNLAQDNPDNVNVIRNYTSLLSSRGQYEKAIAWLVPINKVRNNPSLLLQECMLKHRVSHSDTACYKRVIGLSEHQGREDMDYLMALYFTDDRTFQTVKQRLLQQNPAFSSDFTLFEQDKLDMLRSLYP